MDYRSARLAFQRSRAAMALALLGVAAFGIVGEVPGSVLKASVIALVVVDALVRTRIKGGPLTPLAVDALAAGAVLGVGTQGGIALVAFGAYAVAAAITFTGIRGLLVVGVASAAGVAIRLAIGTAAVITPTTTAIQWTEASLFLGALALTLMAGARRMEAARARQQAVINAERRASEMKNEFVAMVTHELRTPLTTIAGFAMTMKDGWRDLDPDEVDDFLRIIVGEAEHLGNLVEDVLAIPRLEAGNLLLDATDFQLRPAVYKIVDLLYPASGERSAAVTIGGNVNVCADPNRVEQVLRNLLENARKYGGDQVSIEATPAGDDYQIVIADNGSGVSVDDRDRIFGTFEQARQGHSRTQSGFGLGLAVAKHLIEAMGGRIWYEPGFPVGARFCFTLPRAVADADPQPQPAGGKESAVA
ncbi:MAG TPA: HAMP domain-containing sensor histidine kinase [Acidimicrobiia bacterium]|nr:HAMP domain-containing sensor histidine kinase [Acidimicrobiia bacterium]